MQYRKLVKNGPDISLLAYGCMRFKLKGVQIDKELALSQLKLAFDNGVNYFDTAYIYHGGKSEVLLGEFVKSYNIREKVYIADKMPTFILNKKEQVEKYFSTQLLRLDTDYIDFYLMHALSGMDDWNKLKEFGIIDFIKNKKENGKIRYVGFSFHGKPDEFIKILEDYPWDFCQIQYNYLDENNQAGKAGLMRAYELGIGVAIMEPLRGGALAVNAPDRVKKRFSAYNKDISPASWALKFVMNHKEVSTVLSGMNDNEHILENIDVACATTADSLTDEELNVIDDVKEFYSELMKVPCTGCNYCMPCPFGVDIPATFSDYNSQSFFGKRNLITMQYVTRCVGGIGGFEKSGADQCKNCGKCTKHCPQDINIPKMLKEAHKALNKPILNLFLSIYVNLFMKKRRDNGSKR